MKRLYMFIEKYGFEVCTRLANLLAIRIKNVRIFFIYATFFIGVGFFLYLILAFLLKIKDLIYQKRTSSFDL